MYNNKFLILISLLKIMKEVNQHSSLILIILISLKI